MANITITIPDNQLNRCIDAFATKYNWDGTTTKSIFAKQKLVELITSTVYEVETSVAMNNALTTIKQDLTLT
jgi:hypothetical protein